MASIMRVSAGAVESSAPACRCNSTGNSVTRRQGRSEIAAPQPLNSASALRITCCHICRPPPLLLAARGLGITASARVSPPGAIRGAERIARGRAVEAGADAATLALLDIEDLPIAYLPGGALRVRARVVDEIAAH